MATGKESPRQKMIGMMYLVLTALLTLNVSKEIIDAFITMDQNLYEIKSNSEKRNDLIYSSFGRAKSFDPKRVQPYFDKAMATKQSTAEIVRLIREIKTEVISKTEGLPIKIADTISLKYLNAKDNYDIPTLVMIGDKEDASTGKARILKDKIGQYKNQLESHISPSDQKMVNLGLDISDDPDLKWELKNFHHTCQVGCISILSGIENEIVNAESIMIDYLLKKTDSETIKFDTIAPKVIPQSNYVLLGQDYKADIFMAAFSKTQNPEIILTNTNETIPVEKGIGKLIQKTTKEGIVKWNGKIRLNSPSGKLIEHPFHSEYIVAKPTLTGSAEKMNVVYTGVENPLSISVAGVPSENISAVASNGKLIKINNGRYHLIDAIPGKLTEIEVSADLPSGKQKMGKIEFRTKQLPKPYPLIGAITGNGKMRISEFKAQQGIAAKYDANFEFNANCNVVSYDAYCLASKNLTPVISVRGKLFNPELQKYFTGLKKGDRIYFENIKAMGPDKVLQTLTPITIEIF